MLYLVAFNEADLLAIARCELVLANAHIERVAGGKRTKPLVKKTSAVQLRPMVTVRKDDYVALEGMIERYRLQGLLEIIAFICGKMAEKVRQQFADEMLAQTYERDACAIDRVRGFLSN